MRRYPLIGNYGVPSDEKDDLGFSQLAALDPFHGYDGKYAARGAAPTSIG